MAIKVQQLDKESFAPYGSFFSVHEGYSDDTISFLPDRLLLLGSASIGSLCSIRLRYRPLEITTSEYHDDCEEVFGGFNTDVIFHVGLLGNDGQPDLNTYKVFMMPAGCYARLKRKVLHHAAYVHDNSVVADGLVILPPAAYTIDCKTIDLNQPITIKL